MWDALVRKLKPRVEQGDWSYIEDKDGEGRWVPTEYESDAIEDGDRVTERRTDAWAAYLSGRIGFDVFDSSKEAVDHIIDFYGDFDRVGR